MQYLNVKSWLAGKHRKIDRFVSGQIKSSVHIYVLYIYAKIGFLQGSVFGAMTLSIMTFAITTFNITNITKNNTQHNDT